MIVAFVAWLHLKVDSGLLVHMMIDCLPFWNVHVVHYSSNVKNTISITFTWDRDCSAFLDLREPGLFHCDDWNLVSRSYS